MHNILNLYLPQNVQLVWVKIALEDIILPSVSDMGIREFGILIDEDAFWRYPKLELRKGHRPPNFAQTTVSIVRVAGIRT